MRRSTAAVLATVLALAIAAPAVARPGIAPLRIDAVASCEAGPAVDVTLTNPGRRTLEIWDVHLRMTPVQPGPGGIAVEVFVLLIPEAATLSPGESATFGISLPGYELPGRRLLVDVAVFLIGRHRPASIRVTAAGCPG
jgi:hypothetical protein